MVLARLQFKNGKNPTFRVFNPLFPRQKDSCSACKIPGETPGAVLFPQESPKLQGWVVYVRMSVSGILLQVTL